MKIAYVAGPYRAGSEYLVRQNIRAAEAVALELWRLGFAVICPHKNSAGFGGYCPDETWLAGDLAILTRCADVLVLVPGAPGESAGTRMEVAAALGLGLAVVRWPEGRAVLAAMSCSGDATSFRSRRAP